MLKSVKYLYYQKYYIQLLNIRNLHMVKMIIKLLYIILHMIFLNKHVKNNILSLSFLFSHIYGNMNKYIYKYL